MPRGMVIDPALEISSVVKCYRSVTLAEKGTTIMPPWIQ